MGNSTADLISRLSGPGAREAWDALAERYGADVWRLISSRLGRAHEAEDAYQEFWLALPRAAQRFAAQDGDSERKARAWLMHIAYTTAIAQVRQRRSAEPLDGAASDVEAGMAERAPDEELVERVRQAMRRLPEEQRQPLLLHIVGGLSYDELAGELRCTGQNARVKVHRALKRLRELLGVPALDERALAGALVPPLLLPALPAFSAAPVAGGTATATAAAAPAVSAAGPLAILTQVPVLIGAGAALATAVTATAVITLSGDPMPVAPTTAALLAAGALSAAVLDDFERPALGMVSTGQNKMGCTLDLVDAPAGTGGGSGKAMRMTWPSPHGMWVEVAYQKAQASLAVTAAEPQVATVKLWMEGFCGAKRLSTRFTDAKGESFQWRADIPEQGSTGWRTVTTPIDWAKPQTSWGNADKIIDWPLRFQGFAIEFDNKDIPSASIVLDDAALNPATAK